MSKIIQYQELDITIKEGYNYIGEEDWGVYNGFTGV